MLWGLAAAPGRIRQKSIVAPFLRVFIRKTLPRMPLLPVLPTKKTSPIAERGLNTFHKLSHDMRYMVQTWPWRQNANTRQILYEVWGPAHGEDIQYLRVYVSQVRDKVEPESRRDTFERFLASELIHCLPFYRIIRCKLSARSLDHPNYHQVA